MTDATLAPADPDHRAAFRAAAFADVLRSEWTKLRSVRSTFWALTVTRGEGQQKQANRTSAGPLR